MGKPSETLERLSESANTTKAATLTRIEIHSELTAVQPLQPATPAYYPPIAHQAR
jgi:hypothetical protein